MTEPAWAYTLSEQLADGASGNIEISVAQISATFGAGPSARVGIAL